MLLVLIKIKLELYNNDLVFQFKIKPMAASKIFLGGGKVLNNSRRIFAVFNSTARKRGAQKASAKNPQNISKKCESIIDCNKNFIE